MEFSGKPSLVDGSLNVLFTREVLDGLKTRGFAGRIWHSVMDPIESGLVDLTILWLDNLRSGCLAEMLWRILLKLAREVEQGTAWVLVVGGELAMWASVLAVRCGNMEAYLWRSDRGFWL